MKYIKRINLDIIRFILALMIIGIHIYPFNFISNDLDYMITRVMFRIAVPIFLMITGYYIMSKDIEKLKNYTKKITILYLITILLYLPLNLYNGYFKDISILNLLKDIFINGTFYHLWYFPALLLGLWIVYFLIRKFDNKVVSCILSILFIIGIFGDNYYGLISNINILNNIYKIIFKVSEYTRNGLFYTPIFIYMGYLIKNKRLSIGKKNNLILVLVSFILMMVEGGILYYYKIPKHSSMYFFLLPLSYLAFNYLININNGANKRIREISNLIYILHPWLIVIVHFLSKLPVIGIILNNSLLNYITVAIATTLVSIIYLKLKEIYLRKKA